MGESESNGGRTGGGELVPTVLKSRGECQAVLGGQTGGGTWVSGDDRQRWRCRGSLHQDFQPSVFFFFWSENNVLQKQSMLEFHCLYSVERESLWKLRVDIPATAEHHMKT